MLSAAAVSHWFHVIDSGLVGAETLSGRLCPDADLTDIQASSLLLWTVSFGNPLNFPFIRPQGELLGLLRHITANISFF